jgi:hypothetical protein
MGTEYRTASYNELTKKADKKVTALSTAGFMLQLFFLITEIKSSIRKPKNPAKPATPVSTKIAM